MQEQSSHIILKNGPCTRWNLSHTESVALAHSENSTGKGTRNQQKSSWQLGPYFNLWRLLFSITHLMIEIKIPWMPLAKALKSPNIAGSTASNIWQYHRFLIGIQKQFSNKTLMLYRLIAGTLFCMCVHANYRPQIKQYSKPSTTRSMSRIKCKACWNQYKLHVRCWLEELKI